MAGMFTRDKLSWRRPLVPTVRHAVRTRGRSSIGAVCPSFSMPPECYDRTIGGAKAGRSLLVDLGNYIQDDPSGIGTAVVIALGGAAGGFPPCWAMRPLSRMFIAAFRSRSISSPQAGHLNTRYSASLSRLIAPHLDQVLEVLTGLTANSWTPAHSAL